jgi:hypothetical protein
VVEMEKNALRLVDAVDAAAHQPTEKRALPA